MEINKITDEDVKNSINGNTSNYILREYLCGKDVRKIDMSGLSLEFFKYLSFDENTKFNEEQIAKYNPSEILESAKSFSSSMDKIHNNGITGKGIKVAIIDTNLESNDYFKSKSKNINIIKNKSKPGKKEVHGATVLSSFLSVAPDSEVIYYANDKTDRINKDGNFLSYIEDIIRNHADVSIVSISASFNSIENENEAKKILDENGITLITSPIFYNNFTYSRKSNDKNGNEVFDETFVEEDEYSIKEKFYQIEDIIKKYNLEGMERKEAINNLIVILKNNGTKEDLGKANYLENNMDIALCTSENEVIKIRKQKIIEEEVEERKENESVEIPCAGRTFIGKKGVFKYFSTASASYTIPQVAALYALAKQQDKDITFEKFITICKETSTIFNSIKSGYKRRIINPEELFIEINKDREGKEKSFSNSLKDLCYEEC